MSYVEQREMQATLPSFNIVTRLIFTICSVFKLGVSYIIQNTAKFSSGLMKPYSKQSSVAINSNERITLFDIV